MEDAIKWVIEHRTLPVERKQPRPHEASETRAAKGLRKLRKEKAFSKLPATTREALDKVSVSPSCGRTVPPAADVPKLFVYVRHVPRGIRYAPGVGPRRESKRC